MARLRDAIVFSGWGWEALGTPERICLALAQLGCKVLHCVTPVSVFRSNPPQPHCVSPGVHSLRLRFLSSRLNYYSGGATAQARMLRRQIESAARGLDLHDPLFLFSGLWRLWPLAALMKRDHYTVHICVDHSMQIDPQYERYLEVADKTLAIPPSCYHKFKARYGEKVVAIPQSGNVREIGANENPDAAAPAALAGIPRPRLGYFGLLNRRVNTELILSLLHSHPDWHFISCGSEPAVRLPNAHSIPWQSPGETARNVQSLDVGFMPYNLHDEEALHCVPLKLWDYFAFGLPVVSTPAIHLWEYKHLMYLGDSPGELTSAIRAALDEPVDSPKRAARMEIACRYSLRNLAVILRGCLPIAP